MGSSFPIHPFKLNMSCTNHGLTWHTGSECFCQRWMARFTCTTTPLGWQCRVTSERRPSTCLNLDQGRVDFPSDLASLAQFQYVAPFPMAKSRYPKTEPNSSSPRGQRSEVGLEPLCVAGLEREWRTVGTSPAI